MRLFLKTTSLLATPLVLAAALAFRPAAGPPAGFVLQGEVAVPNGTKIYLDRSGLGASRPGMPAATDSAVVTGNRFTFRGRVPEPTFSWLRVGSGKERRFFFLENKPMTIQLPADAQASPVVTGSAAQAEYAAYDQKWQHYVAGCEEVYTMLAKATPAGEKEPAAAARQQAEARFVVLRQEAKDITAAHVAAHPNTVVAAYLVYEHGVRGPSRADAARLYQQLGPVAKASYWGQQAQQYLTITAKTSEGATPEFAQADPNGKLVKLSDFRGKYVLVDFWASWCGPCRAENPNVKAMYSQYHAKGFDVLAVSLDSKKEPWLKAIETDGLPWTHVSDLKGWKNAVAVEFGIQAVPQNFLVDPQGKVIAKNLRGEALQQKMAQVFAGK